MKNSEQEEMKISPAFVRRLRTERGWSQEQLAVVSGLSLRTIQRVEAGGSASRETRTSLAATFDCQLADLAAKAIETQQTNAIPLHTSFTRYKVSALIAGVTFIPVIIAFTGLLPKSSAWLAAVSSMLAVALIIYAGLGWYLAGSSNSHSRARYVAQTLFIFSAIFCGFASMHNGSASNIAIAAQIGLLSMFIYFALYFVISRRRIPSN